MSADRLCIGFIPLTDAAALIVAADKGFAARQGLEIELVREVSWSNVRDKLNIGLFDAAHLLAPVAIASSLGIGHVKVPLLVPSMLNLNGNAVTVSPALYEALAASADDALDDPKASARALAAVVRRRRERGDAPLVFGMTFPFSTHNYLLRFWMAAGGVDPEEDVQLVVLPPPYMVDSLSSRQVDGFCVGAPWNSVAVELGVGTILHFGCDIVARAPEKVLAVRAAWAANRSDTLGRLLRAIDGAAAFLNDPAHLDEVAMLLAAPRYLATSPELVRATIEGRLRTKIAGAPRAAPNYLVIGRDGAARPDPVDAAWLYAQMARWQQTLLSADSLATAKACFRPDLYDAALGAGVKAPPRASDMLAAFAGPLFDANDIAGYLAALKRTDA